MSCCHNCKERKMNCHASCERYAAEMEENKKRLEERRKDIRNREAIHSPAFQRRSREYLMNKK